MRKESAGKGISDAELEQNPTGSFKVDSEGNLLDPQISTAAGWVLLVSSIFSELENWSGVVCLGSLSIQEAEAGGLLVQS